MSGAPRRVDVESFITCSSAVEVAISVASDIGRPGAMFMSVLDCVTALAAFVADVAVGIIALVVFIIVVADVAVVVAAANVATAAVVAVLSATGAAVVLAWS